MKDDLLIQEHISSGRIPTEKGIRLYINDLLSTPEVNNDKIRLVSKQYSGLDGTLDEVITTVSNLLSSYTRSACLITLPNRKSMKIQSFKIVSFSDKKIVAILVFEGGITEKTYIKLDYIISIKELNTISEYLNQLTFGLTLREVKEKVLNKLKFKRDRYSIFVENVVKFGVEVCEKDSEVEILINGKLTDNKDNALDNLEVSKNLLHVFEHKNFLVDLLGKVLEDKGTKVFIGKENGMPKGCSLIAAPYGDESRNGSLGVFGPIRMNYSEIIPLVNLTVNYLSNVLSGGGTSGTWQ